MSVQPGAKTQRQRQAILSGYMHTSFTTTPDFSYFQSISDLQGWPVHTVLDVKTHIQRQRDVAATPECD